MDMNKWFKAGATSLLLLSASSFTINSYAVFDGSKSKSSHNIGNSPSKLQSTATSLSQKHIDDSQILVKFKNNKTLSSNTIKKIGLTQTRNHKNVSALTVFKIKSGTNLEATIKELNLDPNVEYAQPNYKYTLQATEPNDPLFTELWGIKDSNGAGLNLPAAWSNGATDDLEEVVVGVIDTGIDYNHPDLQENIWVNPNEIAGNGIDDDNNGWVDDIHGIDPVQNDSDPMDELDHGTHVAGTIAAVTNNGIGVAGVSNNSKLIGCKIFDPTHENSGSTLAIVACLDYFLELKKAGINIVVTNNSWGSRPGGAFDQAIYDGILKHREANITFVAAAGNDSNDNDAIPVYPASYELNNVISVAALNPDGTLAQFSNFGKATVDIAAPGVAILSTVPNNEYAVFDGTSMAAPHVAGLVAMIRGMDSEAYHDRVTLASSLNPQTDDLTLSESNARAFDISDSGGALNCNEFDFITHRLLPTTSTTFISDINETLRFEYKYRGPCGTVWAAPLEITVQETGEKFLTSFGFTGGDGTATYATDWSLPNFQEYNLEVRETINSNALVEVLTVKPIEHYTMSEVPYTELNDQDWICLDNIIDENSTNVSIGFDFKYYNQTYSDVAISDNGFLSFDTTLGDTHTWMISQLPSRFGPNNMIAPFKFDLINNNNGICYKTTGEDGNKIFSVKWENVDSFIADANDLDSSPVSFSVTLHEKGNDIVFNYKDVEFNIPDTEFVDFGGFSIIGTENENGTFGDLYSFLEPSLQNEFSLLFKNNSAPNCSPTFENLSLRGSFNSWGKQAMTFNAESCLWESEAIFTDTSNNRFKLDRFGDWKESYGDDTFSDGLFIAEEHGDNIPVDPGTYSITFNDITFVYSATKTAEPKCDFTFNTLYLRGSFNDWDKQLMTKNTESCLWETTATFDDASNNRFKFDVKGDWSNNYGDDNNDFIGDKSGDNITVSPAIYKVTFDDASKQYNYIKVGDVVTEPDYKQRFDQLYVRGTLNDWKATDKMTLVADNTWQIDVEFGSSSKERFKFDVYGDWSYKIGDNNDNGWAKRNEDTIAITEGAGTYRITINDSKESSFFYTIEKL